MTTTTYRCPPWLDHALQAACALPLAGILLLTFTDVLMRYLFARPLTGATELIRFAMALSIFAGLPLLTRDRGHITVSLMNGLLSAHWLRLRQVFCDLVSLGVILLLAWQLFEQGLQYQQTQATTLVLEMPMAPLAWVMAAFSLLTALLLARVTWHDVRGLMTEGGTRS